MGDGVTMKDMIIDMWEDGAMGRSMLVFLTAVIIFIFALIGGCVNNVMNHLDHGRVTAMHISPAYWHWVSTGKSGYMMYEPEHYVITITDGIKEYTTTIDKERYEKLAVGYLYQE